MFLTGQVDVNHFVDDDTNLSKKFVEYDVSVRDAFGGQSTYKNLRKLAIAFGTNDFDETILEGNEVAFEGKLEVGNIFNNKNFSIKR